MDDADEIRRLVDEVNAAHGYRFALRGRADSGLQSGAWMLADPSGRLAVLKQRVDSYVDIELVAAAVARVRAAGYPTPAWLASGRTGAGRSYWVQDHVPGRPATPLTMAKTELLLEVLERQAGLDPLAERDPAGPVTAMALSDEDGGPRGVVRAVGPPGTALLAAYDRLLADAGPARLTGTDLVHGDFNTCNVLLGDGGVTGVIDVQDLGTGSRVIDYACLLREACVEGYGDDVVRLIRRTGEGIAGWAALVLAVAATAFFIVGFKLRHDPAAVPTVLDRLGRLASDLARPG
jgi:aminoglycoside phosphotransferase (APT) family kinase protein